MKSLLKLLVIPAVGAMTLALLSTAFAADAGDKDNPTKEFMKKYHKAPQGTDTVAKKAQSGKATPEELKALAEGYHAMAKAKPPVGEMGSWKEKTEKAASAADALVKGEPNAVQRYKEAVNCKACHDTHRPKQ